MSELKPLGNITFVAVLTDLQVIQNKFRLGDFSGFHSGVAEDSILVGYVTLSLANWLLAFRDNAMVTSSRAEMSKNSLTLEYDTIMLFKNVRNQLVTDVVSYPTRRDTSNSG
jgi:hypothetical protein